MVKKRVLVGGNNQVGLLFYFRIGSEKRNIFGNEIKSAVAPGPGIYDVEKGA